ncbi:1-hydroxycarotenoid 3,4-desaturase CrtD [Pseudogemmobacter blasticus]|uniref:Methoxyneurosporene dehydrogenase n=1 Tax=Fuscovulum blasticum DSM 2131 TaxID=1188250 RepID=A0A2T4JA34_FUSBL|nr:1-hydroxycarotenoid 3,4-desaturase CrtD [Fuscovulum blasticum]AWD20260.1 hypothetical protein B6K69_00170 [Fuscovulum blasticum]PTE14688.1 methoxyneurosporene dehydrogenase [Fuscovulum blasticum DSM 2131]
MENIPRVIIIGAGFGGLAAALSARSRGWNVTVVEAADAPGGKARTLRTVAGPVDTGPTVLTFRNEFDELFERFGEKLDDHVRLVPQTVLARHFWPDGSTLDLFADPDMTEKAIKKFAGEDEASGFRKFYQLTSGLYKTFRAPVMQSSSPEIPSVAKAALKSPKLWSALVPGRSLPSLLKAHFKDPRLIQLFGRYATYVGGRPQKTPAVMSLIWQAEANGVWGIDGGMSALAKAVAKLAQRNGVTFRYGTKASKIERDPTDNTMSVTLETGETLTGKAVIFNGDPAALAEGYLGPQVKNAVPPKAVGPRSLSAQVWAFAATPKGPLAAKLGHHNLFFSKRPEAEFDPLLSGKPQDDPTLYVCAEDRAIGKPPRALERFEIIVNAPAGHVEPDEAKACALRTFPKLAEMGLTFDPPPGANMLTTPTTLEELFPASQGAIYGRSPEGTLAAFAKPQARSQLKGLYLAGGGAHPGAGVPMATRSGKFAADAMVSDLGSVRTSRPTATPGGTSTASPTTGSAPSR